MAPCFHGSASESESDGFFYCRLEEGRKLARKGGRASAEKWVRHLRARRPFFLFFFFCDGCQDIIQLRLRFFSLLSLLSHEWFSFFFFFFVALPSSPPALPRKSAKRGESYYAWHVGRGRTLIWTRPSWSISTLAQLQHSGCVCVWERESVCVCVCVCVRPHVTAKLLKYAKQQIGLKVKQSGLILCGNDLFYRQQRGGTMNWIRAEMSINGKHAALGSKRS